MAASQLFEKVTASNLLLNVARSVWSATARSRFGILSIAVNLQ